MFNDNNQSRTSRSSSTEVTTFEFAEDLLRTYEGRISHDWIDGLLYMLTAGERTQVFRALHDRIHTALELDLPKTSYCGAHVEGVLGDFGSGKSHIAFMTRHNLIHGAAHTIIMHCQMTGERHFPAVLAKLLKDLHLGKIPAASSGGVQVSSYHELATKLKLHHDEAARLAYEMVKSISGSLEPAFASDFIEVLSALPDYDDGEGGHEIADFIEGWVAKETNRNALTAFEAVLATFVAAGCASRCVVLIDEFEALESAVREEQLLFLQSIQDLHDDFGFRISGLPSLFLTLYSTPEYWRKAATLLPSMFSEGDRTRATSTLPPIEKGELYGLFDRYQTMFLLAGRSTKLITSEDLQALVEMTWQELTSAGRTGHMRSVHDAVNRAVRRYVTSS